MSLIIPCCRNKPDLPVLTTENVTDITQVSAVSGGNISDEGGSMVTERGVCWNISSNPDYNDFRTIDGEGEGSFVSNVGELTPGTAYYLRAYAKNEYGTGYGQQVSFSTMPVNPATVITRGIVSVTATSAVTGGNILNDGGGNITAKGVCWAENENPTIDGFHSTDGTGKEGYNSYINGLEPQTNYYVRAYASNSAGTAYGTLLSFSTEKYQSNPLLFNPEISYGTFTDVDGNPCMTVEIGKQVWMAENLKVTKYYDGSAIKNVITDEEWNIVASGAYCWYNNDIANKENYGALYNWYAVSSGKLCPLGWHIPDQNEWLELINAAGGISVAGGLMKETGTTHWLYPNTGASNGSGFTAVPSGIRTVSGYFQNIGGSSRWWKSTEGTVIEILNNSAVVNTEACCVYRRGLSVRCLKNH